MKKQKLLTALSVTILLFSAFAILMVSVMAWVDPRKVMDLVDVKLNNNDAFSSIRGVYGGVGLTIVCTLVYLAVKDVRNGLVFTCLFWGGYASSRLITLLVDGPLGAFGRQWLTIESSLFIVAAMLLLTGRRKLPKPVER